MEIKRQLTAVAKRISPQIEAMNIGVELRQIVTRIEELVTYGEQKEAAKAARGGVSSGLAIRRRQDAERQEIKDVQTTEERDNLEDQEQGRAQPDAPDRRTPEERAADREANRAGSQPDESPPAEEAFDDRPHKKAKKKGKGRRSKKKS